jgi:hypothetical protein
MEDWSGSSIDGSLDDDYAEFHSSNVVVSSVVETQTQTQNIFIGGSSQKHEVDNAALLIPSCNKLNQLLHKAGYSPIDLTSKDIDANRRSVSVFVVDAYVESVCSCVAELLDHQLSTQANVSAVSLGVVKNEVAQDALQNEVSRLQDKLSDALRREKAADMKRENAGRLSRNV